MNVLLNESGYTLDGKWRLVPVEPTYEMAILSLDGGLDYKLGVKAAPPPPPPQQSPFAPDWANYQQGRKDGRADAVADMRSALSAMPVRRLKMSGQRFSYVQLDELNGELDAIYSKPLPEPTP